MKDIKNFFDKNNRLNKGYSRLPNVQESDNSFYHKKFAHILPPIDIMQEFENLHPGTLGRLIDMAEKEQHHRHALDLVNLDAQTRALKSGRNYALVFMLAVCVTTLVLAIIVGTYVGIVFASIAFISVGAISFLPFKKNTQKVEINRSSRHRHTAFKQRRK